MAINNDYFWNVLIRKDTDYKDYGGKVERWDHPEENYFDCSTCKFYTRINEEFGICINSASPRTGLLTFQYQAGYRCHKS